MSQGTLLILSGPSGAGKSTVIHRILERHPDFFFSVSATTRQPRGSEKDGVDYHFITPAQFEDMIAGQSLLEYNHYYHNHISMEHTLPNVHQFFFVAIPLTNQSQAH